MIELAWFAAGAGLTAAAFAWWHRRPQPAAAAPPAAPPSAPGRDAHAAAVRPFAGAIADELANLASGVEGCAVRLIDDVARPDRVPRAAENLWRAVRRLRHCQTRLFALAGRSEAPQGDTALAPVFAAVREELQHLELGLTIVCDLPRALPRLRAAAAPLTDAVLFACSALLHLERGARRLAFSAEPSFGDDGAAVDLEVLLEWDEDPGRGTTTSTDHPAWLLDRDAAQNLFAALGATLQFDHDRGHAARALARVPALHANAADAAASADEPVALREPTLPRPRHRFGGVLLLERDPEVRAMLASELKAAGRAVFACADDAAARSLLQATPERFELLIVDQEQRLQAGDPLAQAAANLSPQLKVCVLTPHAAPIGAAAAGPLPRVHRIQKPFGPHELRSALAVVLEDG